MPVHQLVWLHHEVHTPARFADFDVVSDRQPWASRHVSCFFFCSTQHCIPWPYSDVAVHPSAETKAQARNASKVSMLREGQNVRALKLPCAVTHRKLLRIVMRHQALPVRICIAHPVARSSHSAVTRWICLGVSTLRVLSIRVSHAR